MKNQLQQRDKSFKRQYSDDFKSKDVHRRLRKHVFAYLCIIFCLSLFLMVGCSSKSPDESSLRNETDQIVVEESPAEGTLALPAESDTPFDVSKIIYTGQISLNTDNYGETFDKIKNYTLELGGFIEESGSNFSSQDQNRPQNSGYLRLRIPADQFTAAMTMIQSFASPLNADVSSNNISQQYQDVESQLNNLKVQEQRLLDLVRQATTMTDILAIENELSRIRTEIDQLSSTQKNWDLEINYSTIYVSLYEKEISSTAVSSPFSEIFTRIGQGFVTSINLLLRMLAFLIVLFFSLLPFAALALLGLYLFIKIRKKVKEKKQEKAGKENHKKANEDKEDQSLNK